MPGKKLDVVLKDLVIGYNEIPIVSNINLTLPAGKISVILGGSGCGKSTLLKHILKLHPAISGEIRIGGRDITEVSRHEWACLKLRLGLLFQAGALLGSLTLGDNVALPLKEHTRLGKKVIHEITIAKLGLVGLSGDAHLYPNQLSGGMRKRAGLARAMVMDPDILFCDEPTSGLDPINSVKLDLLLLELNDRFGITIIVVSHDLTSMRTIADHVVMLGDGKVLFDGAVEDLENTTDPYLRQFLDRQSGDQASSRLTMPPLDPAMLKLDCSKYLVSDARGE